MGLRLLLLPLFVTFGFAQEPGASREEQVSLLEEMKGISYSGEEVEAIIRELEGLSSVEDVNRLGIDYATGESGKPKNLRKAAAFFRLAAEKKHADAQSRLGFMYNQGWGVSLSYKESAIWFEKAAIQGNPKAQFNLGLLHHYGLGVPKDDDLALRWLRKSADQGYEDAKVTLKEIGKR